MPKILLVDDDVELTELLAELLALESFDVKVLHNGQDALDELKQNLKEYDIVLLDVMMPVLNGVETLKQIRAKFNIPVLMLSARDSELDRVLGLELGADDYLPKPFNERELIARVKAILRRSGSNATPSTPIAIYDEDNKYLTFENIQLHLGRQQVVFEGRDLDLTGTEFALLHTLIRNPGQVFSRELLSLEILGKPLTPFDRAIDMHMSNLRRKLPERINHLPWFKTLRGRGYLLITEK